MKNKPVLDQATKEELERQELLKYEQHKAEVLSDISVVVHGHIIGAATDSYEQQLTRQCLESIRNLMPQAEIILSVWKGDEVKHLPYDKLVINQPPVVAPATNIRREIIATYNGLKAAAKKYAIKVRSDYRFIDTDFVGYLRSYTRGNKYRFFEQRIVISANDSKNPRKGKYLLHPAYDFQVGLRDDLLNLWSVPLPFEDEANKPLKDEQYLWQTFCQQHGLNFKTGSLTRPFSAKVLASEQSIINNFVIASATDLGVILPKNASVNVQKDAYTHDEWYKINKRYSSRPSKIFELGLISKVWYNQLFKASI